MPVAELGVDRLSTSPEATVPTLLIVAAAAVLAIAGLVWLLGGSRRGPLDEVERWSHARDVTTRWSEDPESAPAPVKRMARQMAEQREQSRDA